MTWRLTAVRSNHWATKDLLNTEETRLELAAFVVTGQHSNQTELLLQRSKILIKHGSQVLLISMHLKNLTVEIDTISGIFLNKLKLLQQRVMGFEPTLTAWKAVDLAINLYSQIV